MLQPSQGSGLMLQGTEILRHITESMCSFPLWMPSIWTWMINSLWNRKQRSCSRFCYPKRSLLKQRHRSCLSRHLRNTSIFCTANISEELVKAEFKVWGDMCPLDLPQTDEVSAITAVNNCPLTHCQLYILCLQFLQLCLCVQQKPREHSRRWSAL